MRKKFSICDYGTSLRRHCFAMKCIADGVVDGVYGATRRQHRPYTYCLSPGSAQRRESTVDECLQEQRKKSCLCMVR